jgi:hypothetical protein
MRDKASPPYTRGPHLELNNSGVNDVEHLRRHVDLGKSVGTPRFKDLFIAGVRGDYQSYLIVEFPLLVLCLDLTNSIHQLLSLLPSVEVPPPSVAKAKPPSVSLEVCFTKAV